MSNIGDYAICSADVVTDSATGSWSGTGPTASITNTMPEGYVWIACSQIYGNANGSSGTKIRITGMSGGAAPKQQGAGSGASNIACSSALGSGFAALGAGNQTITASFNWDNGVSGGQSPSGAYSLYSIGIRASSLFGQISQGDGDSGYNLKRPSIWTDSTSSVVSGNTSVNLTVPAYHKWLAIATISLDGTGSGPTRAYLTITGGIEMRDYALAGSPDKRGFSNSGIGYAGAAGATITASATSVLANNGGLLSLHGFGVKV